MTKRFISVAEVLDRIGLSRTHLYRKIKDDSFPRPVPLGPRKVAFLESEITEWMTERLNARDKCEGNSGRKSRAINAVSQSSHVTEFAQDNKEQKNV